MLALAGPLAFAAAGTASAATTQTASCTDAGNHVWKARSVWGKTYKEDDGSTRVINNEVAFTSTSSDATTADYSVTTYDGSGDVVKTVSRQDLAYDFDGGASYYKLDPRNPPSDPGRSKIVLKVGDGNDSKDGCTVTFTQPGAAATPPPAPTSPAGSTCEAGDEIVKFDGQGSADLGQYGEGNYNASAELWGVNGYNYDQTMGVCTNDSWYVNVKTDNSKGDGAVKAYPSMRRIYHDWSTTDFSKDPLVSSFPRLDVAFGSKDPSSCSGCIYNTAFDIWLNGIGNGNANELMIWTHNVNQTPYGTKVGSGIKIAGHTWDLWSGNSNHYLAFVPTDTTNIPSGTFDVQDFTSYLAGTGRIVKDSRLGQISYGVEAVSTNGVSRRWDFTKFSVSDS
jgi:hypothetical protein